MKIFAISFVIVLLLIIVLINWYFKNKSEKFYIQLSGDYFKKGDILESGNGVKLKILNVEGTRIKVKIV